MRLYPEEPEAGPWRAESLAVVVESLAGRAQGSASRSRPVVVAIDGRSSSGKTTLAGRMHGAVPGSAVVHTDDIAWRQSRFGWADLLITGLLTPVHRGGAVTFRPPQWAEHGREGTISVPAGCPLLLVEGVGAGRAAAAHLIDVLVWVQADEGEAERRSLARAGEPGGPLTVRHLREWMAEEVPFVAADRAWERAGLLVSGTPEIPCDPATEIAVGAGSEMSYLSARYGR